MTWQQNTVEELLGPLSPEELKAMPGILYWQGDKQLLITGPRIAIVGSRKASTEGTEMAKDLAIKLVKQGATIVSGLALGIDTAAHTAAINTGGRTIAVLATPPGGYAVRSNRTLQDKIGRGHLLISQFKPNSPVVRRNFPMRNRTMAILSDATIIVEAGETSGTRHQGWESIRCGRPVLFSPKLLSREDLTWPKEMLNYGAVSLEEVRLKELLNELPSTPVESVPF
ncbi:MAG: DNA-processing protein DprA [Halieaceae bacterium]|nr:DNA-processing protein DprA [Halieaceae bacterium]